MCHNLLQKDGFQDQDTITYPRSAGHPHFHFPKAGNGS